MLSPCTKPAPCVPQLDGTLTSDTLTADMKKLFQIAFQENPNKAMTKNEVYQVARLIPAWHSKDSRTPDIEP